MKVCGVLERRQTGRRSYAEERLAAAAGPNYVLLDKRLLCLRSSLVAFVLTVNLSPQPIQPMPPSLGSRHKDLRRHACGI
jgi:hypothetical protein